MGVNVLELDVPVSSVSDQSVVGLENTIWLSGFGLTVLKVHVVCTRYVHGRGSTDLSHDSRSSGSRINVGTLNQGLLVDGARYQLSSFVQKGVGRTSQ
jgi:hypothetical protein